MCNKETILHNVKQVAEIIENLLITYEIKRGHFEIQDTRNFTFIIYINIIHLSHLKLSETNYSYVNLKPLTYSTTYVYKRIEKVSIQSDSYNSPLWIH